MNLTSVQFYWGTNQGMSSMPLKSKTAFIFFCILLSISFSGCIATPSDYANRSREIGIVKGWEESFINTKVFNLSIYEPKQHSTDVKRVKIFIEGDGFSWVDKYTPSRNPTPKNPVALTIALALNETDLAYIARPCQNTFGDNWRNCETRYWTNDRFSPEVINSMNMAVQTIKQQYGAQRVTLIGYSGGSVLALLLAAQRTDVDSVVTIAGNIDTDTWTTYHNITPLKTQNPALLSKELSTIRQTHFVGEDDEIVPAAISYAYTQYYDINHKPDIRIIKGFSHGCCWENIEKYKLLEAL